MKKKPFLVPSTMKDKYDEITGLINDFCDKQLDDDYKEYCGKLCATLCRKRPSPLLKGRTSTWACAIIHAIGTVNFLFDKTLNNHMKVADLAKEFKISPSTCSARSKEIQEIIDIYFFNPEWTFPKTLEDMPFNSTSEGGNAMENFFSLFDGLLDDAYKSGLTPEDLNNMLLDELNIAAATETEVEAPYKSDNVINFEVAKRKSRKKQFKSSKQEAEELVALALQAESTEKKREYALRALNMCKDCTYAYMILAQISENLIDAITYYELAVDSARKEIGELNFKKFSGQFWIYPDSRPYMNARLGLAETLWLCGKKIDAVNHLKEMLILNPDDNQGIRYLLINMLLLLEDYTAFEKIFEDYSEDIYAGMLYAKALYLFKTGKLKLAEKVLKEAFKANQYIPALLLGKEKMPKTLPEVMGVGDINEAVIYVADGKEVWKTSDGALEWLDRSIFKKQFVLNSDF